MEKETGTTCAGLQRRLVCMYCLQVLGTDVGMGWCGDVLKAGAWYGHWEGMVRRCVESRCLGRRMVRRCIESMCLGLTSGGDGAAMY